MDWKLWILSGLKQIVYLILGAIVTVILGALASATGFVPAPGLQAWVWTNGVYPFIVTIIALIKNWYQHQGQPAAK